MPPDDGTDASQSATTPVADPSQAESTSASEEGAAGGGEAAEPTVESLQSQLAELTTRVETDKAQADKAVSAKQSEYDTLIAAHNKELRDVEIKRLAEAKAERRAELVQLAEDEGGTPLAARVIADQAAETAAETETAAREQGQTSGSNDATANLWQELRNSPPFKEKSNEWIAERYAKATADANGGQPSIPQMSTVMVEALMAETTAGGDLDARLKALENGDVGERVRQASSPESPPSSRPTTNDDQFLLDYGDQKSDDHERARKLLEAREAVNLK
jgi:uncharacterized protein with gpF-like domain